MSSQSASAHNTRTGRAPVQLAALAFGIVFILVGLLGFVPGVTTNYDELMLAGSGSGALLLGIFQVSILHNIVHLLFGVAGILFSRTFSGAKSYLIWGGVVYLVLWVYGLFASGDTPANFVPLNNADNWLHLVLAIAMIGLGVLLGRRDNASTNRR